tara:strand:- start:916 stop:1500 length:585 start_codon:yes stop_codon:yes gene_type:complete
MKYINPFDHLIKNRFFDKSIIDYLRNSNLKKLSTRSDKELGNTKASKKRFLNKIIIQNKLNPKLKSENKKFYLNLFQSLKKKIDKKFYKKLNINNKTIKKGSFTIMHAWDKPGFFMKPHIDTERKIWTGIVYLFGNGKSKDGCTTLIGKKVSKDIIPSYNKFLAFKRNDDALHCVKKNNKEREIILINYNYKNS